MKRSERLYAEMIAIFFALVILTCILRPENYPEWETPILLCGVVPFAALFLAGSAEAQKARAEEGGGHA